MKDSKKNEPMDPSFREAAVGTQSINAQRACYALETLVDEVQALFPETPVEYSNYTGRNAALDVMFDGSSLSTEDFAVLSALLELTDNDPRVNLAMAHGSEQQVLVSMLANVRTQDSREPFNLADALDVLSEPEGFQVMSEGVSFVEGSR